MNDTRLGDGTVVVLMIIVIALLLGLWRTLEGWDRDTKALVAVIVEGHKSTQQGVAPASKKIGGFASGVVEG